MTTKNICDIVSLFTMILCDPIPEGINIRDYVARFYQLNLNDATLVEKHINHCVDTIECKFGITSAN